MRQREIIIKKGKKTSWDCLSAAVDVNSWREHSTHTSSLEPDMNQHRTKGSAPRKCSARRKMSVHIRWWRGWRKVADNQDNTPGYLILYRRWNEQNDQEKDGVRALKYTLACWRRHGTRERALTSERNQSWAAPLFISRRRTTNLFFLLFREWETRRHVSHFVHHRKFNLPFPWKWFVTVSDLSIRNTTTRAHKWNVTWVRVERSNVGYRFPMESTGVK